MKDFSDLIDGHGNRPSAEQTKQIEMLFSTFEKLGWKDPWIYMDDGIVYFEIDGEDDDYENVLQIGVYGDAKATIRMKIKDRKYHDL